MSSARRGSIRWSHSSTHAFFLFCFCWIAGSLFLVCSWSVFENWWHKGPCMEVCQIQFGATFYAIVFHELLVCRKKKIFYIFDSITPQTSTGFEWNNFRTRINYARLVDIGFWRWYVFFFLSPILWHFFSFGLNQV